MIKRTLGCLALCGWLMAASGLLQAHHSLAGVYDMKGEKELSGTVATVKFTNPHGSLSVAVKNPDGSTTEWVQNRTECAPHRGQPNRKVPPGEGRQPAGVSQDGDHAGRARDPDLRRQRQRLGQQGD